MLDGVSFTLQLEEFFFLKWFSNKYLIKYPLD